jgi:hypothetical protein
MIPLNFWVGITISGIAELCLLVALFVLIGKVVVRVLSMVSAIIAYAIIVWSLWVPITIAPLLASGPGNYATDTDVYGIKWQPDFSDLTLLLHNYGDNDLTNLDIIVRTDLTIVTVGMAPGINTCSSEPYMPVPFAAARITALGGQSTQNEIPLLKGKVSANVYRLRCERLSAHSQIEAKLPIVGNKSDTGKHQSTWAKIWVGLMAGYRPSSFDYYECFRKPCHNIPDTKDGKIIR